MSDHRLTDEERKRLIAALIAIVPVRRGDPTLTALVRKLSGTDTVVIVRREPPDPAEQYASTPPAETYHMTPGEQRIMDKALRRSTHLVTPAPASDLSTAAKAWYTHIDPQPTVHGKIQGLAAALAEAKAEQHAADVAVKGGEE